MEYVNAPSAARHQTINYNSNKTRLFTFYHFSIQSLLPPVAKIHNLDVPFSFFGSARKFMLFLLCFDAGVGRGSGAYTCCLSHGEKKLKVLNFRVQHSRNDVGKSSERLSHRHLLLVRGASGTASLPSIVHFSNFFFFIFFYYHAADIVNDVIT